ncbi:MAG: hypothetical protein HY983_04105 [Candidatus Magasanikbacteria bacterium]|nr:hypothetical protein [Candidatus Magasanikbacteria bacterium]
MIHFNGILVFSSTHPNSEKWYRTKKIYLTWQENGGQDPYVYAFNAEPDYIPGPSDKKTSEESIYFEPDKDGTYYFHIVSLAEDNLKLVGHYKIKIDTTPPETLSAKSSNDKINVGEIVRFEFAGEDKTSGIQKYYYVKIDNNDFFPVLSPLYLSFPEKGIHEVTFRVFDKANNYRDKTSKIDVSAP